MVTGANFTVACVANKYCPLYSLSLSLSLYARRPDAGAFSRNLVPQTHNGKPNKGMESGEDTDGATSSDGEAECFLDPVDPGAEGRARVEARRRTGGRHPHGLVNVLLASIPAAVGRLSPLLQRLGSLMVTNRFQTTMVIVNIVLVKVAVNALRKARFAAHVRVVKDLKPEDLKYLLGKLPPWISSPEWEAGKPAQELLSLLWPALNSTICLALKNVIEDRLQGSAEYGHINFSRFSLGRSPPQICGIKAVPLHEEDVLAMVVDLDVRWAGEPDVVLHLSRVKRATIRLKNLQISTMVRLVFTPIIEDPPFFQRMTVTLLNRPLIDFTIKVLGGADVMALPAISRWLHSAILSITDRFIVWPKEVNVALIPNLRNKNNLPMLSAMASTPPVGVLIVTIEEAKLQQRRSTFLGRYKLPNPRIAMITPKGETDGVAQMTLTGVNEKTLDPSWKHTSTFVIGSMGQPIRFLLSHRRVESYFGADMPLGSAEADVWDLLRAIDLGDEAEYSDQDPFMRSETASVGNASMRSFKSCLSAKSRDLSGFGDSFDDGEDGYDSACSSASTSQSPLQYQASGIRRVAFASSAAGSSWHEPSSSSPPSPESSISFSPFQTLAPEELRRGAGLVDQNDGARTPTANEGAAPPEWNPGTPPSKLSVPWQSDAGQPVDPDQMDRINRSGESSVPLGLQRCAKECVGSTWVDLKASPAMTMSGLVHSALQPLKGVPSTPLENSLADLGGESNLAKAILRSFRSFMMKSAFPVDNDSDGESVDGGNDDVGRTPMNDRDRHETSTSGTRRPINLENATDLMAQPAKVKISFRWIPVSSDRPALDHSTAANTAQHSEAGRNGDRGRKGHKGHEAQGVQGGKAGTNPQDRREQPPPPSRPISASTAHAAGVVAVRIAFTKIDYGDNPLHPIISLSVLPTATTLTSTPLEHLQRNPAEPDLASFSSSASLGHLDSQALSQLQRRHRVFSTECQTGHRPGVLHWGQVFHLPVWKADACKIRVELGNISSALKLSSYGTDLFLLEASTGLYDNDVEIEASTNVPLKDVLKKGFVDQNYRLREAKTEKIPGILDDQRLDVGRVAISMSWHPMVVAGN